MDIFKDAVASETVFFICEYKETLNLFTLNRNHNDQCVLDYKSTRYFDSTSDKECNNLGDPMKLRRRKMEKIVQ